MVQISTLQLQLENLQIIFEEEILNGANIEKIKSVFYQIKGLEKLIADREVKLQGRTN